MIRKIILSLFCSILFLNVSHAFSDYDIENMEMSMYGNIYSNEDYGTRIKRLETDLLGMTQSGDIEARVNMLKKMQPNSNIAAYSYPYDGYYNSPKKGGIRNFFNNISSSMFDSGVITGYTPAMTSSYSNNIYRNEFMNFANNPYGYCPYSNGYNRYNRPYNNYYRNSKNNRYYHNSGNHLSYNKMPPHYHNHYGNSYYNSSRIGRYPIIPTDVSTNIATRSTVHILQD